MKNLEIIKSEGREILTHGFDVLIRNSIAHKSYVFDPCDRVVRFSDPIRGRTEPVPYRLLFEKTRDLSCLVLALAQFKGMVYDAMLMLISTYINKQMAEDNGGERKSRKGIIRDSDIK